MKRRIVVLSFCLGFYFQPAFAQIHEETSPPQSVRLVRAPKLPPAVQAHIEFYESSGNGLLDAEETGSVMLRLSNMGNGKASNLSAKIIPSSMDGLSYESAKFIGDIQPNKAVEVSWPIRAAFGVESGVVNLEFRFVERSGFEPAPIKLKFNTKAFIPPDLTLANGVNLEDANQNGMIDPGEVVTITARVINEGRGGAKDVKTRLRLGENVYYAGDSPKEFNLGDIGPGRFQDFNFTIYTNMRATGVPVFIDIAEHYGKFGKGDIAVPVAFRRPARTVEEVTIAGKQEDVPAFVSPSNFFVDVDNGIPQGRTAENAIGIVFGVESYRHVVPAPYARRDATIFREYLKGAFGIPDDRNHIYFRLDDEVTRGELEKVFSENGWLAKRVDEESDVIIYFSGHGAPDLVGSSPYLIPSDGDPNYPTQTGFSLARLYDELSNLRCRSITVFLDACFSGVTRDNSSLLADARPVYVRITHPALGSNTVTVFTSAGGDQISSSYPEMKHGLFTYYLLKGLRGNADADKDRTVTVEELEAFVIANVKKAAGLLDREQVPQVFGLNKERPLVKY